MNDEVIDAPVSTEAAPVVDETKDTAPPSADSPNPDEKAPDEAKPEEKLLTQKEVDEAIQRRLHRESRKLERQIRAEIENKYLKEQIEARSKQDQPTQPTGAPRPEQFATYEDYLDKLTDYKLELREAKAKEQSQQAKVAEFHQTQEAKIKENLSKAAEKYDDFEDVVGNPNLPITPAMRDAIGESEMGGEIAYHLGLNPRQAAEIAQMSPVQQVKAIDKLEQKLKAPQLTKAPDPAETVGKGRTKIEPDLSKMSVSEYAEYRAKHGARWARN